MLTKSYASYLVLLFGFYGGILSSGFADTGDKYNQEKSQIFSLIKSGDYAKANSATEQLIANYSVDPNLDEVIHQIAMKYHEVKNYEKEIELSRYVITNWPKSKHAVWAQMDIVMANLLLGNDANAQKEVKTLITNYSDDPNYALTLCIIGQGYRNDTYGQILKEHFRDGKDKKVKLAILNSEAMSKLEVGDYSMARASVDKMISECATDGNLPMVLFTLAQQFVWTHQYEQAGNMYKHIIQHFPDSPYAIKAQQQISKTGKVTNVASALIESGSYDQVGKAVDELITKFGDEPDTPATLYHIAGRLEELGQFAPARYVYEQIVWRYPKEEFAAMSRMGVQRTKILAFEEMNDVAGEKAAFDKMLSDFNGHSYLPSSVVWTAEGYYRKALKFDNGGDNAGARKYFEEQGVKF